MATEVCAEPILRRLRFVRSPNQLLRPTDSLLQLVDNAMTLGSIALVIEQAHSPDSRHLLL